MIFHPRPYPSLPAALDRQNLPVLFEAPKPQDPFRLRDKAMLELLYGCGLRAHELAGLKVSGLRLDQGYLRCFGKGRRERLVPIGHKAIAARTAIVVTNKCPESEPRYCIVKDSAADFLNVDRFTSKEYLNQNSIQTGTVGEILGFNVKEASQIVTTTSPTQTHRLVFAREAIALVSRRLPDPPAGLGVKGQTINKDGVGLRAIMGYNMDYLGVQVTVDMVWGVAITRTEWLCELVEAGA